MPKQKKAQNLRDALNILDPELSLQTREDIETYFVSRPMSPIADLTLLLEETTKPQVILFTGHRGSGKSSELTRLELDLQKEFVIVRYSVKNVLNLFDMTYVDVILSLGLELIREATAQDIQVDRGVLSAILDFAKDVTKEVQIGDALGTEVGAELNFIVVKLQGKLKTEDETRTTVREKVTHRLSDLLDSIDLLCKEIERITKKRLLIILEDLDKTDLKTAKELFYNHATSLLAPHISAIYTFPTALRHDNDFMQVEMNFPNIFILPNLKLRSRDGKPDAEGIGCLSEILTKRVQDTLIETDALNKLAEFSSGIPRELIALSRRACLEAMKSESSTITSEAVDKAVRNKRIDYQVLLTGEQLQCLSEVKRTKTVKNNEDYRALLHNLSVVEYRDDKGVWYDTHPIVDSLLVET